MTENKSSEMVYLDIEPTRIGVIGGSGLYQMEGMADVELVRVATPLGEPSDPIMVGRLAGERVAFLSRHGRGHRLLPGEVPYQANILALKMLGVEQLISISACGSLREDLHPGDFVIPDQLYDHTRHRTSSFFGKGLAAHVSVAEPFCARLGGILADAVEAAGGTVHRGGTLITIEGPRFSSKGESHTYRHWGMDLINMTTCPEAFLAREAEICYAVVNAISDYDCWHESEEPVTVETVIQILMQNAELAKRVIANVVVDLSVESGRPCGCGDALGQALITQRDLIPADTLEHLSPLIKRYFQEQGTK
jgi:5'-methylthioadenosine phosphorylase